MKANSEEKIKHLEFIQDVITRMNSNSFQIKGWSITITAALLALYASSSKDNFILIAIAPTLLFWFLDSIYLQQERKFRGVYNDVVELSEPAQHKTIRLFEMPIHKYTEKKYTYSSSFFSKTILTFYGVQIILLLVSWLILSNKGAELWQRGECFIVSIMGMM